MTREQWRAAKAIVGDALDVPERERAALVASRCAGDRELRVEVEALLTSAMTAVDLFEAPLLTGTALRAMLTETEGEADVCVGRRIGAYRIVSEIGRGGMGAAFLGERADLAFTRRVAIKLIKRGMDTDAILRRFLHERQILASLSHPNIATLLDGGSTDDDRPYFVMEYVDGLPIDDYCNRQRLSIPERIRLFQDVCRAVAYAHGNRVIHRDLKPANILVTADGVPKLLDFGIAKVLDASRGPHTAAETGAAPAMTLAYASPEQVRGAAVTQATDIYSLGVLLYELLAGHNPQLPAGRSPRETERAICEETPPIPSTMTGDAASSTRGLKSGALRRRLIGDLDAIVMTALRKDPARRYGSVAALAEDLQRHLDGLPVAARSEWAGTRALKRILRRPGRVAVAAGIALATLTALAVFSLAGRNRPVPSPALRSIAVLPIDTAGTNRIDLEFLAEGITENVIRRLSRLPELKVIARDSAYQLASRQAPARLAAHDLGVQAVLEGTLTVRGGVLTLDVELLNAADGARLWGERFSRATTDVQFLQAELASAIANRLQLQVSSRERARAVRRESVNPDAYQLYLRGRYFWNKRTPQDLAKSVDYFSQATAKDPSFALAYTGLADSHALLSEYHAVPPRETYGLVKAAIGRALALDDELPEAHTSLAYMRQFYEWDWSGAETEFLRALELEPRYATAHQWYAEFLSAMGRHDEAIVEAQRATDLDPLSLIANSVHAYLLYLARRYDRSIAVSERVLDLDRNFPEVYIYLKRSYEELGRYDRSIVARQTRRRLLGLNADLTPALQAAASATDSRTYWTHRLEQELLEGREEGLPPFDMAEILAQAGETGRALDWLERACRDNDFMMVSAPVIPTLDPLRSHPRFQALMARGCRVEG